MEECNWRVLRAQLAQGVLTVTGRPVSRDGLDRIVAASVAALIGRNVWITAQGLDCGSAGNDLFDAYVQAVVEQSRKP